MAPPIQILCVGREPPDLSTSAWGPFVLNSCATLDAAAAELRQAPSDAVLIDWSAHSDPMALMLWPSLSQAVLDAALVVVAPEPAPAWAVQLLKLGAQDVLPSRGADSETLARVLRQAVERKRIEQAARKAYATDLATGLPNHAQLLEHMTHLAALREREPAPMALVVLRIEGLQRTAELMSMEAANVLRRKAAVRLRSGLRASDVVASIGSDSFAVLLAWMEDAGDVEGVAVKLAQSLRRPFDLTGQQVALAVSVGVGQYPTHGKDADSLLRRALGQAASVATVGATGLAHRVALGPTSAANDEGP